VLSSDDDEDVNWRDLEEECVVGDLMDRYAAGTKFFLQKKSAPY